MMLVRGHILLTLRDADQQASSPLHPPGIPSDVCALADTSCQAIGGGSGKDAYCMRSEHCDWYKKNEKRKDKKPKEKFVRRKSVLTHHIG